MRPLLLLLGLLGALLGAARLQADPAGALYEADVPVASQDNAARDAGLVRAFQAVLVKAAGTRRVLDNPQVAAEARTAASRVVQFYFRTVQLPPDDTGAVTPELRLHASFQPAAVDGLLRSAGEPRLSANRPATLLWIALDDGTGPRVLSRDADAATLAWFSHFGAERAMPLAFPAMDLEESVAVTADRVAALDEEALLAPSARYGAGSVVLARLVKSGTGEWLAEWKQRTGEETAYGQAGAPALAGVAEQLVGSVAEQVSARFAVRAGLENAEELRIRVDGVGSLAAYRALAAQLARLGSVRESRPGLIERDTVFFDLLTDSGIDSVLQEIALVPELRPEGDPAERRYRWATQ